MSRKYSLGALSLLFLLTFFYWFAFQNKQKTTKKILPNLQIINHKNKIVEKGYQIIEKDSIRMCDAIIIHSTYNSLSEDVFNVDSIIKQFNTYKVSSHYMINREGNIYQLVDENNIAYHAGPSLLSDGRTCVNNFSIGIEIINTIDTFPTEKQYISLGNLIKNIKQRRTIKYIQGHSNIAPTRKSDPWNFDWKKLDSLIYDSPIQESLWWVL